MVKSDYDPIRHHVAGNSSLDLHGLNGLTVDTPVNHRLPTFIRRESLEHIGEAVNSVSPHPRPRRVRADPSQGQGGPHRALTACLDDRCRRLSEDRGVGRHQVTVLEKELLETVVFCRHLFAFVEDVRHVANGLSYGFGQREKHRQPALHVG